MGLLTTVLLAALVQAGPIDDIKGVLDAQVQAWNKGDIAGYMEGYWKSDSLVFTSGGTVNRGWRATFDKYAGTYNTRDKMGVLTFSDVEVSLLSPEGAWVLGKWELVRGSDRPHGVFTLVLRKFGDGWRITHDHTSVATRD